MIHPVWFGTVPELVWRLAESLMKGVETDGLNLAHLASLSSKSHVMNLDNARHTTSHTTAEPPSTTYPLAQWSSRSSQRMAYPASNGNYYATTQGSPPVSPTMAAAPYTDSYTYGSATSAQASGMTSQHHYHSTPRHSPYQAANGQSPHSVSPSSLPYPSQSGMTSPDPRPGYTHSRSSSESRHPYSPGHVVTPQYGGHVAVHTPLMVQGIDQMQYPASPQRPFACDMCALSFNRQHDLKRHRETHSGEKPFLCNGGCGKTFTRKDALKRHQVCSSPC